MITHGLHLNPAAVDGLMPLPPDVPALRVDVHTRGIIEVSPALANLLGCGAEAVVGRPLAELWPVAERAAIGRRLEDAVLVGRDVFGCLALNGPPGETVFVEADARYTWHGHQHVDVALRPVRRTSAPPLAIPPPLPADAGTGPIGPELAAVSPAPLPLVSATVPVTAEAGGPPGASQFLVMTALSAAAAAALAVDSAGLVVSATPEAEALLGRPIARLRGTRLEDLLTLPVVAGQALAAARRSRSRQSVAAALAQDGRQVALEWVPGGRLDEGFVVLACDRPESADTERLRVQSRLVSFVSHDVRDSLAAAFCSLHNLSDATPPTVAERAFVDKALGEIQRASRIVDDVLAVSRPGSLIRAPLSLSAVLRDTLDRFRPRAAAGGVEINERLGADVQVSADLSQLERAFGNLVENALQAIPHFGSLTVTTRHEDRGRPGVCVDIADTGVGIQAGLRPNVFEPFVTDKPGGTGLGLAITWRAILNHEGQISFESEEGRGTTFTIWLPRL
jgi:signal transduction histidine kinase